MKPLSVWKTFLVRAVSFVMRNQLAKESRIDEIFATLGLVLNRIRHSKRVFTITLITSLLLEFNE